LYWALQFLMVENQITFDPFTNLGTSHNGFDPRDFTDTKFSIVHPEDWEAYCKTDLDLKIAKIHPKIKKTDSIQKNIQWFTDTTKRVILLYFTPETKVLGINNWVTKVFGINNWVDKVKQDWWDWHISTGGIDLSEISEKWNLPNIKNQHEIPQWVKREFLSYYLLPAWEDQVEWYLPDRLNNDRCLLISVSDLLSNFLSTINQIKFFCELDFKKNPNELLPFHHKMLLLQKNLGQDLLFNQILHCTLSDKKLDWSDQYLSLATESLIQHELRKNRFEIACDGLDNFPTNSEELKKIIYKI